MGNTELETERNIQRNFPNTSGVNDNSVEQITKQFGRTTAREENNINQNLNRTISLNELHRMQEQNEILISELDRYRAQHDQNNLLTP